MIPSAGDAMRMIAGMSLRRARRSGLIWISAVLLALVLAGAVVALASGRGGLDAFDGMLELLLRFLVPFIMVLHGSSAVAEEVQGRTITYLFARPIPRWTLPMGKYVGNLLFGAVMILPVIVLLYFVHLIAEPALILPELPHLALALVATALAILVYGAMATAIGTMVTGYPFAVTLIIFLLIDAGASYVPGWLKAISMNVHLRAVAGIYEPTTTMFMADPVIPRPIALAAVLGVTSIWIFLAVTWVQSTEYRTDR